MRTAREVAKSAICQRHWIDEAKRIGLPGLAVVAGVEDLAVGVAAEIEADRFEVRAWVLREVAERLWARAEQKMGSDSDEYLGLGAAANMVETMISETTAERRKR